MLKGNQNKLDLNKNGKLDSQDFKMLRGKMATGGGVGRSRWKLTIDLNPAWKMIEDEDDLDSFIEGNPKEWRMFTDKVVEILNDNFEKVDLIVDETDISTYQDIIDYIYGADDVQDFDYEMGRLYDIADENKIFIKTMYKKGGMMKTDNKMNKGGKAKGYKGYKSQFAMEQDAAIKAKKPGKRVSESGNVYYESRPEHSDENRKKKPYLKHGGSLESIRFDLSKNSEANVVNEILKQYGSHLEKVGMYEYDATVKGDDWNKIKKEIDMATGGVSYINHNSMEMAKGGGVKGSDKKLYWYEYYPHMSGTYKAEAVITEKTLHQLKKLWDAEDEEGWEELLNASVKGKKFYFADEIFTQHWSKLIKALKSNKAFGDMTEEGSFAISPNNIKEAKKIVRDIEAEQLDLDDDDYAKGGQMNKGGKAKGYKGYKSQFAMEQDAAIKAKKPGKRVSASGNVYYESRPEHSDENRKKKPYLEKGGEVTGTSFTYSIGGLSI